MPNLLLHYGVQGPLSRGLTARADLKWVLLGCLIPDAPWIFQRAVGTLPLAVDPIGLRLYAYVQATLFFALLLAACLALLARRPGLVFGILALNAALHLVLDGLQEKWGVGVFPLAPLSWRPWSADTFAMEGVVTFGVTGLGLVFVVWVWLRERRAPSLPRPADWEHLGRSVRPVAAAALLGAYLALPFTFTGDVYRTDVNSIRTLAERDARLGRAVSFDREEYRVRPEGHFIVAFTGEPLEVVGSRLESVAVGQEVTVSAHGTFVDPTTVEIHDLQVHSSWFRDTASYVGLLILAAFWLSTARAGPGRLAGPSAEGTGNGPGVTAGSGVDRS